MDRPVDALLFDVGNVLIRVDFGQVFRAWASAAQVPLSRIASRFREDDAYCDHERGTLDHAGYFAHLRAHLGIDLPDDAFLSGWNRVFGDPVEGMEDLLRSLAGTIPLYAFSNTNAAHRAYFLPRHSALFSRLVGVFCSCELGKRKPEPAAFAEVARRMHCPPERIAFFDDLEDNVAGARSAGLHAFRVTGAGDVRAAVAGMGIRPT